ncbi:FAD-dependent pyridine nucleotide-disulfide oxidoreductase [Cynara cardunculus var. scolymus]|uniref:glutathione-disulfide reductase n=1 Tax=Cynara cardunculus var. scolymus TaxID=59895 RepID=A0A103XP85_CYNCS|nr:FAD-dependent pyridine nucleotide-disulfide oxidoreductase [Cynara cardunculus var. scolymus]
MATSLSTPKLSTTLSSSTLQTLLYRHKFSTQNHSPFIIFPQSLSSSSRYSSSFNLSKKALGFLSDHRRNAILKSRRFATRADSTNGAEPRYDYDLFTIGAGSGGVRASRFASNFGASVAVCELPFATISSDTTGGVGGTCVLRGCVPKKLLVYASKYSHEFEESLGFGWSYGSEPTHDWSTLMANKNAELQRLTVDVDGKLYTAKNILVSVGGRPFIPEIPGREYVIDSDAALDLPSKPTKIAIVGGGYIALEFAGIFNGLQSEVHVFIRQKKVLRGFDEEVRDFVAEQMSLKGIEFHPEESPQAVIKSSDGSFSLKTNKGTTEGFSHVMFATGRKPNTKNLGLETVGVKLDKNGAIEVDEYSRTSVPSIWAVGDVTDRMNLTPVALMEGGALAKTLFANEPTKPDFRYLFSQPPIGQVGLSEEQAIAAYGDINVFTANFRPLKATLSGLPDKVFMKLVVCAKTDQFDATIGVHPTSAEEFVTMRTPTRKIRNSPSGGKADSQAKAAAGV